MRPKIWLLYLVLPGRYGLALTALLVFSGTALLLQWLERDSFLASGNLYFCMALAYIVPVFSYIQGVTHRAVDELHELLDLPPESFETLRYSLSHKSLLWQLLVAALATLGAGAHLGAIYASRGSSLFAELAAGTDLAGDLGAVAVWLAMTTAMASLLQNGRRVGRLAHHLREIDLLRADRLLPFARIAIVSTLSLTGSLALFPFLMIDVGASPTTVLPGLVATLLPMGALLLLPLLPARREITAEKARQLARINLRLASLRAGSGYERNFRQVSTLLDMREHIERVPDWPVNTGVIGRLGFYLIIPPLTWVGAAMIENLVDAVL